MVDGFLPVKSRNIALEMWIRVLRPCQTGNTPTQRVVQKIQIKPTTIQPEEQYMLVANRYYIAGQSVGLTGEE